GVVKCSNSVKSGLDRVTPKVWRGLPWRVRAVILNLLLLEGRVPEGILRARVTMIPKSADADGPGDYRPISVASVIVRHLHRIVS
ncbi:hypothetical protein ACUWCL_29335, partial [Klebsiella pneumoniae]|uniref:hypothetical protein n=1 Tax=Klebsiella pneumoniae TaxID=573 RepID=UPI0040556C84